MRNKSRKEKSLSFNILCHLLIKVKATIFQELYISYNIYATHTTLNVW